MCARRLFEAYPVIRKDHFKHFEGMTDDVMKSSGVGRAHAMSVFSGIGAFVSSLEDNDCLEGLATKLVRNHIARNITSAHFQVSLDIFFFFFFFFFSPLSDFCQV